MFNYSTMLLREDLNLLVVGAREAIYALDLSDISKKLSSVRASYFFITIRKNTYLFLIQISLLNM